MEDFGEMEPMGVEEPLFYGAVVKKGKPVKLDIDAGEIINFTSAALGAKVGKERHVLVCEVAGNAFVICSLTAGVCENASLNLRFSPGDDIELRLESGNGEIHLTGFKIEEESEMIDPYGDFQMGSDEDEDEDEDEDDMDEEVRRNTELNAMMGSSAAKRKAITMGKGASKRARVEEGDEDEGETGAKAGELAELMKKHFFEGVTAEDDEDDDDDYEDVEDDEDEDEMEDDEDEDEDEEGIKHVAFGESSEEESEEEEETQQPPKKKHVDSKVQRVQTPKKQAAQPKQEAKKAEATPKQTPAGKGTKVSTQTPATAAKKPFTCPDCNKGFAKEEGMVQHQKAVHKSG